MPKVTIYDTRIFINRGELPHSFRREGNPHWENFKDLMLFLGSIGFYVSEDRSEERGQRDKKEISFFERDTQSGWI